MDQPIRDAATSARKDGYRTAAAVKIGPALSGYGSESVRDALAVALTPLPQHLRRSVAWDRGKESARHAELTASTGIKVYFCDPYSPWRHITNENPALSDGCRGALELKEFGPAPHLADARCCPDPTPQPLRGCYRAGSPVRSVRCSTCLRCSATACRR